MVKYKEVHEELERYAVAEKAAFYPRFFKTGKGEYGEGDVFMGVTVPNQRVVAKKYYNYCDEKVITQLLDADFHEDRLTGLFILIHKFNEAKKENEEKKWVDLYVKKIDRVNNWDLVDSSAYQILGPWLENKDKKILYDLAKENHLWKNRIAVVTTLYFIRKGDFTDLLKLSEIFMHHPHDLMHKAVGWMLREAWKRKPAPIETFLNKHAHEMPRTMLRYSIEKMDERERKDFMMKKNEFNASR